MVCYCSPARALIPIKIGHYTRICATHQKKNNCVTAPTFHIISYCRTNLSHREAIERQKV